MICTRSSDANSGEGYGETPESQPTPDSESNDSPSPAGASEEDQGKGVTAGEPRPLIPEGEYTAICYKTRTVPSFGGRRELYVFFRVFEGLYFGAELVMYCTYPQKLTSKHKLYVQWSLVIGRRPQSRERFAAKVFRGKMYRVLVQTVKPTFSDGSPQPDFLHYSKVDTILETLTGVPGDTQ